MFDALGRVGFLLNAGVYVAVVPHLPLGVVGRADRRAGPGRRRGGDRGVRTARLDLGRYARISEPSRVWLLAPTWIALNAVLGAWTTQIGLPARATSRRPAFADQLLMRGFGPIRSASASAVALVCSSPGSSTGATDSSAFGGRPSSAIGLGRRRWSCRAGLVLNHRRVAGADPARLGSLVAGGGLFVLAGATPAALGLLADISESYPADRGAIMGLYSVFLAMGQIVGALLRRRCRRRGAASTGSARRQPACCRDRARAARPAARLRAPRRRRAW